jgi:hypothetical protein
LSSRYAGALARKAKALKSQVKACGGSHPAAVINRQQIMVEGIIDPLSRNELLDTERFVKGERLKCELLVHTERFVKGEGLKCELLDTERFVKGEGLKLVTLKYLEVTVIKRVH